MGSIKAFTLWFPRERLTTLSGWMIGIGSVGTLSATAPVEALLGPLGWRALFLGLGALSLAAALLIFFVVPERELPGRARAWREQFARDRPDLRARGFLAPRAAARRLRRPPSRRCRACGSRPGSPTCTACERGARRRLPVLSALAYWSLRSRSAGRRCARQARHRAATGLPGRNAGRAPPRSRRSPSARARRWCSLVAVRGDQHRGDHRLHAAHATGADRADRARDDRVEPGAVRHLVRVQWGVGAILGLWPGAEGRYDPEGYRVAFGVLLAAQAAAAAWLLTAQEARP